MAGFLQRDMYVTFNIKHETPSLTTFPNTEKRVERVLTDVEVFGNVFKHRLECLIYLFDCNLYQTKEIRDGEMKS